MARRLDAEFHVVHVARTEDRSTGNQKSLEANIQFAEDLGAKVDRIESGNTASGVAQFVREKHITQVIFGRAPLKGLRSFFYLNELQRFLREAPAVDVHIVTHEEN